MDAMIKESVASLFCYVIKNDHNNMDLKRSLFCRFIEEDFDLLLPEEANKLFDEVVEKEYNIETQISIIANALHNETYKKMSLLKQLNDIIIKSNFSEEDYDIFDKAKKAFFPND